VRWAAGGAFQGEWGRVVKNIASDRGEETNSRTKKDGKNAKLSRGLFNPASPSPPARVVTRKDTGKNSIKRNEGREVQGWPNRQEKMAQVRWQGSAGRGRNQEILRREC